jgi:hypothetical protein
MARLFGVSPLIKNPDTPLQPNSGHTSAIFIPIDMIMSNYQMRFENRCQYSTYGRGPTMIVPRVNRFYKLEVQGYTIKMKVPAYGKIISLKRSGSCYLISSIFFAIEPLCNFSL